MQVALAMSAREGARSVHGAAGAACTNGHEPSALVRGPRLKHVRWAALPGGNGLITDTQSLLRWFPASPDSTSVRRSAMSFLPSLPDADMKQTLKREPDIGIPLSQLNQVVMRGDAPFTPGERELIAA